MLAHEQIHISFMVRNKVLYLCYVVSMLKVRTIGSQYLGKVLQCSREVDNAHDPDAVKVMKAGTRARTMVGHLPKKTIYLFTVY